MRDAVRFLEDALVIGGAATALMDLWAALQKRWLGVPSLDYRLLGRWLLYCIQGRFRHDPISATPPAAHENAVGWAAHYLIGVGWAAALLLVFGMHWARDPTILPALISDPTASRPLRPFPG